MAEKKYMDWSALVEYDAKIKAKIKADDEAVLASAKGYADGLASNYDAAGSAASALTEAKGYTDTEVAKASAAAAAAQAKAEEGVAAAGVADGKAVAAQGAADAAQGAADAAQAAADKAQGDVDTLAGKVGEVPAGSTVMGIITNIQESAYDDTEIRGLVSDNAEAIAGEIEAREAADEAIDARLVEVEAFFKLAEGEQLDTALDTLKEIQVYLEGEGAVADQMILDIAANKTAIEKEVADRGTAISGVETAYKAADEAQVARIVELEKLLGEADGSVKDQIADAVAAEAALREEADGVLDGKISANAAAAKQAQDEVDALEGVVAELTTVVNGKVAQGDFDALAGRVTTAEGEIDALQADTHTHSNKSDLDGITAALIGQWNEAYTKAHVHENADVLAGITAAKVQAWDAAEGNAKAYTDEKIGEFVAITTAEVDSLFA